MLASLLFISIWGISVILSLHCIALMLMTMMMMMRTGRSHKCPLSCHLHSKHPCVASTPTPALSSSCSSFSLCCHRLS